jgi:hypothetical protein
MHGEYMGVEYESFPPEPLHYELEKRMGWRRYGNTQKWEKIMK